jgi:hypothetical protein
MTNMMLPYDRQLANEYIYSRKFIDKYIASEIRDNSESWLKVQRGVQLLADYRQPVYTYETKAGTVVHASKNARVAQLADLDLEALVVNIFVGVAYCQTPELFTSISAQLAARLSFDDKEDSIKTVAEMMAVLCHTDAYDIGKEYADSELYIQARIPLSTQLLNYVAHSNYLPPMVCVPNEITHNYESGYLTHNECVVLGRGNGHDGDLCLDVINKQNAIPLKLDLEFLCNFEEEPTFELDTIIKVQEWDHFKKDSYHMYRLIKDQTFYLTNRPDKRGRLYAQGYHITTQGASFKKAMIEFADEEIVEGVPT